MSQKQAFLEGEGDAWFARNAEAIEATRFPKGDPVLIEVMELAGTFAGPGPVRVLEIGCGSGHRLAWLKEKFGFEPYGLDPSAEAIAAAVRLGIRAEVGTAERLPYEDGMFDVVIFGFCLYLCDREDLFKIAAEADRVLKRPGWLLIHDFYSPSPTKREYHHRPGLYSYKMDYRSLFAWHPFYVNVSHRVIHHERHRYTDEQQEWVSISVLRKSP